jgi:capsular polysaccharide biosynthesis protein/Mrp family chromosome partitioning ATPase
LELGGYFGIARRWWKALLLSVVLAGVGGYAVASQLPKVYEGEARLLVGPLNTDLETQRAAGQLTNTYAQLLTSRQVSDAVIQRLGLNIAPEDLQSSINAIPNDVSRLIIIRVQNRDASRAASIANAVADELGRLAALTQRPEGQTQVIDPAVPPTTAVAPQVLLIVLLAAFAGFLAAISLVVVVEYSQDAVRSEDDLRDLSGKPVLGRVATRLNASLDIATAILGTDDAEAYRALTARIEHALGTRKVRSVLIAGTRANGQGGLVATGVALAFADRGVATVLVDGDPDLDAAAALGVGPRFEPVAGEGAVPVQRVRAVVDDEQAARRRLISLSLVPGSGPELLRAEDLRRIMGEVHGEAQMTIVASPPMDRSSEALLWAGTTDVVILVVPIPGARRRDVNAAVDALQVAGKRFVGTVIADAPQRRGYRFARPPAALGAGGRAISPGDPPERHEPDLGPAR